MSNPEMVQDLYERHYNLFLKRLRVFAGRDAEDLAQTTFARLLEKSHLHDPTKGTYLTFAVRIARNLWLDDWRRREMAYRNVGRVARSEIVGEPVIDTLARQEHDAAVESVLSGAIESLPPRRKAVMELRMQGIDDRRILADRCGLATPSVAHNLLNAALRTVRRTLAEAGLY